MLAMDSKGYAYAKKSPIAGRGLFAKKGLRAGELVFRLDRPLVGTLDTPRLHDTCSSCFSWKAGSSIGSQSQNGEKGVKPCGACNLLSFCNKECQRESWKRYHKYECKTFSKLPTERKLELPNAARAAIQLLTMRAKGQMSPETWSSLQSLQSHTEKIRKRMGESVDALSIGIWKYSGVEGVLGVDVAQAVFSLVLTNSLTLVTPTYDPLGVCLDPFLALANHSCEPNAFVVMDGPAVSLRVLRSIEADEEITISYVDVTDPFFRRQYELLTRYYFQCTCSKCQKGPTLREDQFRLQGDKLPQKWKDVAKKAEAQGHYGSMPENQVRGNDSSAQLLASLQGLAYQRLEEAKSRVPQEAQSLLEDGINICSDSGLFDITRQPYVALCQDLMTTMLSTGRHDTAFMHALKIYFDINPVLYPQAHHPTRVVHMWTLAVLAIYLTSEFTQDNQKFKDVVKETGLDFVVVVYGLLLETSGNVAMSHGEDSSFAGLVKRKLDEVKSDMAQAGVGLLERAENERERQWAILRKLAQRV